MQNIIQIWPTVRDISEDLGVPYTTAHSWFTRGRIPAAYDLALVSAAKKRGVSLTLEQLAVARAHPPQKNVTHNASHGPAPATRQGAGQ